MSEPHSNRAAGLAVFAAAVFVVCVIANAALDRAGAPGGLVKALGPILALVAFGVFGVGSRTATLDLFIGAGRRVPASGAALAVAALATGAAVCLGLLTTPTDPVATGAVVGVGLSAAALGPLVRLFPAASLSDVIATRFANPFVRTASGVAVAAAAALVAFAGYRTAVAVVETLVGASRPWAETVAGAALLASVASGGLASLIWTAAAAGGGIGLIALLDLILLAQPDAAFTSAKIGTALPLPELTSPEPLMAFVGAAIGAAALIAGAPPAAGCRSATEAMNSGLGGILLFTALAALGLSGAVVLPGERGFADASPLVTSLAGAATLAAALTLAGLGLQAASRAFGVDLARPPGPFPTLASVRLARMRAAQAAVLVGCAVADRAGVIDAPTALVVAMALGVAIPAPIVALAAIPRAGPLAASAASLAALSAIAGRLAAGGLPLAATDLLGSALVAAALAFVAGSVVCVVAPRRGPAPTPGAFDPFAERSR